MHRKVQEKNKEEFERESCKSGNEMSKKPTVVGDDQPNGENDVTFHAYNQTFTMSSALANSLCVYCTQHIAKTPTSFSIIHSAQIE